MGERTYFYYNCPKCGAKNGVEVYDAPSSRLYVAQCQYCDYKEDRDYYEIDEDTVALLTKDEARERGLLCRKCDGYLSMFEREAGVCEECLKKIKLKIENTLDFWVYKHGLANYDKIPTFDQYQDLVDMIMETLIKERIFKNANM